MAMFKVCVWHGLLRHLQTLHNRAAACVNFVPTSNRIGASVGLIPVEANPSASNLDCLRVSVVQGCTMLCTYGLLNLTLQHLSALATYRTSSFCKLTYLSGLQHGTRP